jgi:hypothetical protein
MTITDAYVCWLNGTCRLDLTLQHGSILSVMCDGDLNFDVNAPPNTARLELLQMPIPNVTFEEVIPGDPSVKHFRWNPTPLILVYGNLRFCAFDIDDNMIGLCDLSYDFPMPVELSSFNATINGNNVNLIWQTASEINNSGFVIERAVANSSEWLNIGSVPGKGNSTTFSEYTFTDRGLNTGSYDYRLKQIDVNGNFEYYELESEVVIGAPGKFELSQNYPNPFNPETRIDYQLANDGNMNLSVYDINGKLVTTIYNGFRSAGYYTVTFNASNLASGVYYYKIKFENIPDKVMKMIVLK